MKRLTTRDLVYIAVFGALWGAMEITLGSYLHAVFPQGVTPIVGAGTIMTAIGIIVALVGWLFVPRTGAVLMIGVVAAARDHGRLRLSLPDGRTAGDPRGLPGD